MMSTYNYCEPSKTRRDNLKKGCLASFLLTLAILIMAGSCYAAHPEGGDCATCHTTHKSDEDRLLNADIVNSGGTGCFVCHSSDSKSGAPDTQKEFTFSRSHHPIGDEKECLVCHMLGREHNNGRLERWPAIKLKDPDTQDSHIYRGAKINDFCLSCHDNSPVALGSPPRTPVDLSSAYEFTGHGRIDINEPCTACHHHHASTDKPYLIKDTINNFKVTGNDNTVCLACHNYPKGGFAGESAYLASEHGSRGKLCIDCHNPHGDNKDLCYLCHNDKYSSHYSQKRDKLCIDCHNPHQKPGLKMTKEDEEKLCFLCHKELEAEFGNTRDGKSGAFSHHKVDDEEYGGGRVECSSCHNPHTVNRFNIISEPGTSGANMPPRPFPKDSYNYKTTAYDEFCLKCHDGFHDSFTQGRAGGDLHGVHKNAGYGCQNCHNSHSSRGTGGIRRASLLREGITVTGYNETDKYLDGKNSCSGSGLGLGCH